MRLARQHSPLSHSYSLRIISGVLRLSPIVAAALFRVAATFLPLTGLLLVTEMVFVAVDEADGLGWRERHRQLCYRDATAKGQAVSSKYDGECRRDLC